MLNNCSPLFLHGQPSIFLPVSCLQMDSGALEGLKRRNHSVSRSEPGDTPPLPIFLQQGSAFPPIPQLAGTSPIDKYARILFPMTFALFNLAYWYIYLSKETMEEARYVHLYCGQISSMRDDTLGCRTTHNHSAFSQEIRFSVSSQRGLIAF